MHYLIDGHNLIGKIQDISLDDPNDEVELILRLKSWAAASPKRKVTVYFDGGLPGGVAHRLSTSDIKVIFAPEGKTADSLLIKRIRKLKNPPEYMLITSDQEIIAAAQKHHLPYLRSEAFASKMGKEKRERLAPLPSKTESDDPYLSQSEVAEWLELFGPEPDLSPRPKPAKRSQQKSFQPQKSKRRRSPQELKNAKNRLSDDEIAEWLDLFNKD